jgi:hypothetical protein
MPQFLVLSELGISCKPTCVCADRCQAQQPGNITGPLEFCAGKYCLEAVGSGPQLPVYRVIKSNKRVPAGRGLVDGRSITIETFQLQGKCEFGVAARDWRQLVHSLVGI